MLRYSISLWLGTHASGFPIGTFVANLISCVVLGWGWFYLSEQLNLDPSYKLLILVGFCGGFSTFSTFSLETLRLLQAGEIWTAMLYVAFSILVCVLVLFGVAKYVQ